MLQAEPLAREIVDTKLMPAAAAIAEQAEPQAQRFNEEVIIPRGQQLAEQVRRRCNLRRMSHSLRKECSTRGCQTLDVLVGLELRYRCGEMYPSSWDATSSLRPNCYDGAPQGLSFAVPPLCLAISGVWGAWRQPLGAP